MIRDRFRRNSSLPERASALAPFRWPIFRRLWGATLVSNLGGLIQTVGAGWMMATIATSDDMVALVQASTTLPIMLFSLPAGALADTFDRRRIMLVAQSFMMAVSVLLALFAWQGWLDPWGLLAFTFLLGVGGALHNPSWQASMGDIVPRIDLPQAVSLNSMGFNLMRSVGPAIGGVIVATLGAAAAFTANAASYVALIVALWLWKPEPRPRVAREPFGTAILAGLRYVSMSPNLVKVMGRGALFGFAAIAGLALLPLVARDLLAGGAFTYGLALGCYGLGAILGALANSRVRERLSNEAIVRSSFVIFAVAAVVMALSTQIWITAIALLLAGASWVLSLSLFNVSVQLATPRWVVGRALALYQTATFGGMALGAWCWGLIAEHHGVSEALLGAAAVLAAGALIGLRYGLPAFATVDLDPSGRFSEPLIKLDLRQRSGPLMIMIDFVIPQGKVDQFLAAMADRRRIRLRDGARNWTLMRDLEQPELWTESYHVPTWADYVRHNQRRTKADVDVSERLLALHEGPEPPRVHRMIERQTVPLRDDMPLRPARMPDIQG